ncbi:hypothetical protein AI3013V2_1064 [Enterobacter cloacae]|nr:hypothetical protein AI3013V2_1064 [Enterobacter cloacae]CAH5607908.1 hypothetical protein AI3013V2_1064 [Enterobacter cloacae]
MFKKDEKIFLISLSIMILLYISPIILADRLYIDDILRSQYGYKNWGLNGRPLADAVMAMVNMTSGEIVDISPLPLLIACGAYVVCSLAYYKTAINFIGPFKAGLLFFFVIANPFLLENLSYKFDVLPMILSVAVLLLPFCGIRNLYLKIVAGVLCVAASLSLYQASIGFFCALALIELAIAYSRNNATDCILLKDLCLRAASLLIGYLAYSIIAKHFIQGDYNETHSQMIGLNFEGLQSVIDTSRGMNYQLMRTIGEMPIVVYAAAFLAVLFSIYSVYSRKAAWSGSRFIVSLVIITSPATIYLLSFIHLSLLKNPIFVHRVLVSFCGIIMYVILMTLMNIKRKTFLAILLAPLFLFTNYYSFAYGNALKYQKEYDVKLSSELAQIVSSDDPDGIKQVRIFGTQGSSIQRLNAIKRLPSLEPLIPLYYTGGWWGTHLIKMYDIKNEITGESDLNRACSMREIESNQRYRVYSDQNRILIAFDKPNCRL